MGKAGKKIPPEQLALYEQLLNTHPEIEMKGANGAYTSLNGHMFSFMTEDGILALRLPKDERNAFLEKYQTELAVSHNTVMKEYVAVPEDLLAETTDLAPFLTMSHTYIASLKPKPTTRKKKPVKKE